MNEIISIEGAKVNIGTANGKIITVPIATLQFPNPTVGDQVKLYKNDKEIIVKRVEKETTNTSTNSDPYQAKEQKINKHVFVWVGAFLLSGIGLDRFMRGQVAAGICKLLFGWLTLGLWYLIDWVIALSKAYGSAFGSDDDITFINGKYAR